MTQCTFCNHRDAALLEQQIAIKQLTQAQAARIIGCNKSTVSRHMATCVPTMIQEAMKPEPVEVPGLNVVNALTTAHAKTLEILLDSLAEGDRKTALMAINAETRQLDLMAKITGQVNAAPQVNFLLNPEFVMLKHVIVETLLPYPEARVALSEKLDSIVLEQDGDK